MQALEAGRPGAWMSQVVALVVEWQLAHPQGTKQDCEMWLREEKTVGRLDIATLSSTAAKVPQAPSKRGRTEGGSFAEKKLKQGGDT